jgi:sec-independent protein translocase protein TatA
VLALLSDSPVCRWISFPMYDHSLLLGWGTPSFQELLVILVIVVVLFGAKRLPEFARALGQSLSEFRKARDEFERELHKKSASEESAARLCPQPPVDQDRDIPDLLPQRPLEVASVPSPAESSLSPSSPKAKKVLGD